MRIAYEVDGLANVEHDLLGMGERAIETRPLLELFAAQLRALMGDVFERQGPGWAPLAPSTVAKKGSSTIGRETDAMMESLTTQGAEGHLEEFFGDELLFGTNLTNEEGFPYPVAFDTGSIGQLSLFGSQPGRPLFNIQAKDLRGFTKAVQAYLMGVDRAEFGTGSFGMSDLTFP